MNKKQIEDAQKLGAEIQNFKDCYDPKELWGTVEGPVSADALIEFLIENPHFQQIADSISKLSK